MRALYDRLNKNAILAGVVSSILCIYFFEPIFGFLGRLLVSGYKLLSDSLYDRLFQEIALGKPDYSASIMQLATLMMVALLLLAIFGITRSRNIVENSQKIGVPQEIQDHKKGSASDERNGIRIAIKIGAIIYAICGLFSILLSEIKLATIQSFEQQIKIITPYIDSHEKEILISKFSIMKSSGDFEKIQNSLDSIAVKNKITFPKTRTHFF